MTATPAAERDARRVQKGCASCWACGEKPTHRGICGSGPPPPHGGACECPFCNMHRTNAIIEATRWVLRQPQSGRARKALRAAMEQYDAMPELNRAHWARNKAAIEAVQVKAVGW